MSHEDPQRQPSTNLTRLSVAAEFPEFPWRRRLIETDRILRLSHPAPGPGVIAAAFAAASRAQSVLTWCQDNHLETILEEGEEAADDRPAAGNPADSSTYSHQDGTQNRAGAAPGTTISRKRPATSLLDATRPVKR
ncbi:hypothetical protein BDV96DRAFT_655380 [Lophiotrema nucula]|uniref:Uncharacterized protein n=1 Tax=Lophiotrema nucula TaxID=690887 RepID=A0A6A5YHN9_9PLEO|nr:hypothetical protein BDV96DRAFT_655380 [Lophiotrema nucula]